MVILNIMLVLYFVSVFTIVESGLFNLVLQWIPSHIGLQGNEEADRLAKIAATSAARHGGTEPLWRQVKALERVHTFLEGVQTEIKASRDLLKHVHFNDLVPALRTNRTTRSKTGRTVPMPMMYTNNYFSSLVADFMDYGHKPKAKTSATTTSTVATPYTAVQFSDIVPADIPRDERMYKDINTIFRVAVPGRHIEPYTDMRARANDYKSNMDYNHYPINQDPGHKQRVTLVTEPPRRPIVNINDYGKIQNERNINLNYDVIELHNPTTEQTLRVATHNINGDIYYNRFKNLGQKRFIVVTQNWNTGSYSRERSSKSRLSESETLKLVQHKIFERPTTDYKSWPTHAPVIRAQEKRTEENIKRNSNVQLTEQSTDKILEDKACNENLRKIIEASSYSDDETALVVNLMDQLYHYNRTNDKEGVL